MQLLAEDTIVVHQDDLEHSDGLVEYFHNNKVNGLPEILPVEGWNFTYMNPGLSRHCRIYEVAFQVADSWHSGSGLMTETRKSNRIGSPGVQSGVFSLAV
jgi:hypothetical protein